MSITFSVGLEHYLLVFFILGYYIAPFWYRSLRTSLAPRSKKKSKCDEKDIAPPAQEPTPPRESVSAACLVSNLPHLPTELRGRIASYCGFQGLATVGGTCRALHAHVWESREVWHALAAAASLGDCCSNCEQGWQARNAFRRAVFHIDLPHLQRLGMKSRPQCILDEVGHIACGLMYGDLTESGLAEFVQIATRALSAHDPASTTATSSAERLLRAARRSMDLYTEEQLERLEYAYKSVHQLHALMMASMQNSYEDILEQSFWCNSALPSQSSDAEASDDVGGSESSYSRFHEDFPKECTQAPC